MAALAQDLLVIDTSGWSDEARGKARRALNSIAASIEQRPTNGWTPTALITAMSQLHASGGATLNFVLKRAMENGGEITRAEVYEVAGYEEKRSLKGFTRPYNRVTSALKASGEIPEDAPDLLVAVYDKNSKGYSRATVFRTPAGLKFPL